MLFGRVQSSLFWLRYIVLFTVVFIVFYTGLFYTRDRVSKPPRPAPIDWSNPANNLHPIDHLIRTAETTFSELLDTRTSDLHGAAWAYRERRGRHPPPGFDIWFKFAQDTKAIFVEEFWDQIYHDIEPLWALPPKQLRSDVRGQKNDSIIRVRGGKASYNTGGHFWMPIWTDLVQSISKHLPDMDIAVNVMDEPRMTVPWEDMDKYVRTASANRTMREWMEMAVKYTKANDDTSDVTATEVFNWNNSVPYFPQARLACHPSSPARQADVQIDFTGPPIFGLEYMADHTYEGYVSNYTLSTSICHQPDLQGLHGALIEPLSTKSTTRFFPLFGSSKLATNNEILLPAAMYWDQSDARFTTGTRIHWSGKKARLIWRGVGSGGRHKDTNWRHFHRHRLVAMLNATTVIRAERGEESPQNWALPDPAIYDKSASTKPIFGEWLAANLTDVGFTEFKCFPTEEPTTCSYTDPWFSATPGVPLADQYKNKYLVDVDGNSFSGRYRAFLQSYSLPIKATLFREWHDSRLVAWKHFVPLDNRFGDLYGILRYFAGCAGMAGCTDNDVKGRDHMAEKIARNGADWAEKVLRREDMQIYTLRLLLEYARVVDERRDILGWVGDLMV